VTATIDGVYVDGLAITRGSPRQHVFTFAHGCSEVFGDRQTCSCPCDGGTPSPSFVGQAFRCEEAQQSAEPGNTGNRFFDQSDPLFDGAGIEDAACVDAPESSSSFIAELGIPSLDALELRLMGTEGSGNEDLAVIRLELWGR
jgi:dynein heavy chain